MTNSIKTPSQPVLLARKNRRAFLHGVGALGAATILGARSSSAAPARYAHRFQLFAEGTVTDFSLVWPVPDVPPPPPGTLLRVRVKFPVDQRDILELQTFLASETAPSQPLAVITLLRQRVDKINLSATPAPQFGLFGQIIDNPVVDNPNHSPFGDLTGRVGMTYAEFDAPGDATTFTLLGGAAAGNHASAVWSATGSLHIQGPWQSF
jgi:hypothetical protein